MRYCVVHGTLELCAAAMARLRVNTQRVSVGGGACVLAMSSQSARDRHGPQRSENERTTLRSLFHVKPVVSRELSIHDFDIAELLR